MPRPKNKSGLLSLSQKNYLKLVDLIDSLPEGQQQTEFPKGYLNQNVRDVVAHLHHWHLLFLEWYKLGMNGQKPAMPAEGYTWKTLPDLNRKIQRTYSSISLDKAREQLAHSFQDLQRCIERHTDIELFEKKRYTWTGTTSLAAYLISATSSHYDWALKLIRKGIKGIA